MSSTPIRSEYREVAGILRDKIKSGEYPRGSKLPTEPELADELGRNRATVHKALTILGAEGLVRVHRGKGTFVTDIPKITRDAAGRQRRNVREEDQARGAFDAELKRLGLTTRSEVTVDRTPAPAEVANRLGIAEGEIVLTRAREMYANDVPVQLAVSYFPLDIADGTQLTETDTGPGGAYSRLADLGHAPVSFTEEVDVRTPEDHEIRALRVTEDQRVYEIVRTAATASGRIVEVNVIVLPIHHWRLTYRWPAEI